MRKKRDSRSGQYVRDMTLFKWFFILNGIGTALVFSFVGVNNLWEKIKSFDRVLVVENTNAQEEIKVLDKLISALYPVCACESTGNKNKNPIHYDKNGNVLVGVSGDIGYCQIAPQYHQKNAEAMLLDIYSEEGNIDYANYLFRRNGYKDWLASKKCWK